MSRIGALPSALLGAAGVVVVVGVSWLTFRQGRLLIDPVYPWAVITLVYLVASLLGYLRTEARQREIRNAFSRYMSPHYVQELAAHPEKLVLGGETRTMTIMFADIRGFSALSERLSPRLTCELVRDVMEHLTVTIMESAGVVVDYIGDGLLAMWNAPLDQPDHAARACRAALAMRDGLPELNRMWHGRLQGNLGRQHCAAHARFQLD